jgi:hypothetical protein
MLVILPNGCFYGDTTEYASFKICTLKDEIEMDDYGDLYSTSSGPDSEDLTEIAFKLKPNVKKEEIELKLPSHFGEKLFKGILNEENDYHPDNYIETFPGLSIGAGSKSSCVFGFGVNDTSCIIRVYYSISTTTKEQKKMEFKPNDREKKYFYQFESERKKLADYDLTYTSQDEPVPSSETRNMGIVMSGTPMYTRLEFPYLNNLVSLAEIVTIKEATLFIRPVLGTYDTIPLPPALNLFYFDPTTYDLTGIDRDNRRQKGEALSERSAYGQQALSGNLPSNYRQILYPYYSFNITDFISSQLGKWGRDIRYLHVGIPDASEPNTIQRLLFGDQQYEFPPNRNLASSENRVQLRIVYITYNE